MKGVRDEGEIMASAELPAISHLTPQAKRELLAVLARELLNQSRAPVSIEDEAGAMIVYAVPPDARARAEQALRTVDPRRISELARRSATPERSLSLEEVLQSSDNREGQIP
jgi:hypothetical protein